MRPLFFKNIFMRNIKNIFKDNSNKLGRWNLKDNQEIKCTLANMDSCGDSLCGKPENYKEKINLILKK